MSHPFTPATDPRKTDCIRCGLPRGRHVVPLERDTSWEMTAVADISELCQRAHGQSSATLAREVSVRLEKGAVEYGDSWKTRPPMEMLAEAREEPADAIAWMLLFLERVKPSVTASEFEDLRMLVMECASHLAAASAVTPRLQHLASQLLS